MTLAEQRQEIKTTLEAIPAIADEVTVYDHLPESINAPAIIIVPGDPYLTDEGQTFTTYKVNRILSIVAETDTNEKATDELERITEAVLAEFEVTEVSAPFGFTYNGVTYLSVNATVNDNLTIGQ